MSKVTLVVVQGDKEEKIEVSSDNPITIRMDPPLISGDSQDPLVEMRQYHPKETQGSSNLLEKARLKVYSGYLPNVGYFSCSRYPVKELQYFFAVWGSHVIPVDWVSTPNSEVTNPVKFRATLPGYKVLNTFLSDTQSSLLSIEDLEKQCRDFKRVLDKDIGFNCGEDF